MCKAWSMSTRLISEEEKRKQNVANECYCIDALSLHNRGRFLVLRKPLFFNVGIVPASFSGASFFAWQRRARNTSDWWWTARDYGKGTDGGRSACQILCRFLCKKTASSHTGCGQAILFSNLATWTGLNSFVKIRTRPPLNFPPSWKQDLPDVSPVVFFPRSFARTSKERRLGTRQGIIQCLLSLL